VQTPLTRAETLSQPSFSTIWTKSFIFATLVVLMLAVLSLVTGVYDIRADFDMFWITRVPRTVALMLTGAAMAMSGLVMQLITQNRLVEPTTTGTLEHEPDDWDNQRRPEFDRT